MEHLLRYDRAAAVAYAHRWAYDRNPRYYDYGRVGETAPALPPNACTPGRGS